MVIKTVASAVLAMIALPAAAQEIVPIISPGQAAEGVFYRSRMEAQARRQRDDDDGGSAAAATAKPASGSPEAQKQACDNRPVYRKQYGADHPQVLKLDDLCKAAGY